MRPSFIGQIKRDKQDKHANREKPKMLFHNLFGFWPKETYNPSHGEKPHETRNNARADKDTEIDF